MRFRKEIMVALKICKSSFHFLLYFKFLDTVPHANSQKASLLHFLVLKNYTHCYCDVCSSCSTLNVEHRGICQVYPSVIKTSSSVSIRQILSASVLDDRYDPEYGWPICSTFQAKGGAECLTHYPGT